MKRARSGERGSALIVAVLVTAILSLLGISFLMMAQTESRIARNEMLAAQSLYVAESGARLVKRWFDYPGTALHFPGTLVVDRRQRHIIDESDPYLASAVQPANGSTQPWYKQQVDLDSDGVDDLFRAPYRIGKRNSLLGTEMNPDMRIDDGDATAAAFLADVSATLLAGFPDAGQGLEARISRIDAYAPPYILVGGQWRRYGMASVKVVGRVYRDLPAASEVLAEREVQMVLSEIPYRGPIGPLHSCGALSFAGDFGVHWGVVTADGPVKLSIANVPLSLPREIPAIPGVDPLWNSWDPLNLIQLQSAINGTVIDDPWFRLVATGQIEGQPLDVVQPEPPTVSPPTYCCDHSNVIQNLPAFECPEFDYDIWKTIASSGGREVRYYAHAGGTNFSENGTGMATPFRDITNGAEGIYFFDTEDGQAPRHDNLTPDIVVDDPGAWSFDGVLYLNAESFRLDGPTGEATNFLPPGEPIQDNNQNATHDAGERWIELDYPASLGGTIRAKPPTAGSFRDPRGGAVSGEASMRGILYTNGDFEATGSGTIYGTVIARSVKQAIDDGSATTPDIYWDESIVTAWPPAGSALPRVVVTRWITER